MTRIASVYANSIRGHFKTMFANWQPGAPIRLGDYGTITDNIFSRVGNLRDEPLKIKFSDRQDPAADHYEFVSSSGTEFEFGAGASGTGGSLAQLSASLEIKFDTANTVFFNAAGCRIDSIENIRVLGDALIEKHSKGIWKRDLAVVTSLMRSEATTIVISGGSNASILLEAEGAGVKTINLADASLKLALRRQKSVAFRVVTADGMVPLLGLMQVKRSRDLFGRLKEPRFEPSLRAFSAHGGDRNAANAEVRDDGEPDEMLFVAAPGD